MMTPIVLDTFSGAGGLSEGFFRTGYKFCAHIEMDKNAAKTLETRILFHLLKKLGKENDYYKYLSGNLLREELFSMYAISNSDVSDSIINLEISDQTIKKIITLIKEKMKSSGYKKIDIIIGGPPCQAFSLAGRARDPNKMRNDPRNYLYLHYIRFLKEFSPDIFVFENVPGIKTAKNGLIYKDFTNKAKKLGYEVQDNILNSADFFVLQNRKRLFIFGWKSDLDFTYPKFKKIEHNFNVSDILIDLPPIDIENNNLSELHNQYLRDSTEYLKKSGIRNSKDILFDHITRKHNKRDREIFRFVIEKWLKYHERFKYNELPPHLKTHKNTKSFLDRYKVVAPDLPYAHTITAHISKDGNYYIHPDINQLRSLSIREAARIQSFPDNYKFEGPRTSKFRQIGNAVPPLMAERIAASIKKIWAN